MRVNLPVTGRERPVPPEARLISTTTRKGVITYVNEAFCQVAGYRPSELLGQAHNVIRHPDMPAPVFRNLWDTLKAGRPWMGVVKNRCKNGDYYWVSAYVSPLFEHGEWVGYQSVRTRASAEQIARAQKLYAKIRRRDRLPRRLLSGTRQRVALAMAIAAFGGAALTGLAEQAGWSSAASLAAVSGLALLAGGVGYGLTRHLQALKAHAQRIFENSVGSYVYGNGYDEAAAAELALAMQNSRNNTLLGRIEDFSAQLLESSRGVEQASVKTEQAIGAQRGDIEQVAAAINEMNAAAQEISRNTTVASEAAGEGADEAESGRGVIAESTRAMQSLASEVQQAAEVIQRLRAESEGIRGIVDAINAITEQTNLLALNAAIEAARAGDAGRGFAVVADEVRTLASRAGESATEIGEVVNRLQQQAGEASGVMERGQQSARQVADHAERVATAIDGVSRAVQRIHEMNAQVASAAEEQTAVSEEINRNILQVSDRVADTATAAEDTRRTGETLVKMVDELRGLLRQFSA
ncbi:PAS domain-containing methyl-accepting chemotaxis protein [Alkalilimnicola sp. S0819]|uniref:methyl-accepting chemotaxis protein n=1 Tax=Alkalilimnicola sp. S0819 TaxID=2613922 RepID=UPI0012619339|nr:PAS domain-containing methyl-accepting chemotaxis protein [Alkalilimnicola sp. S0819]KAB7623813.1 methyl-accepting chemotaxis protein [Alkalilimnicola sp. S0819]MPQ16687.1 PAS domain-containing protein [Alkalilimnicola sp. S0819]